MSRFTPADEAVATHPEIPVTSWASRGVQQADHLLSNRDRFGSVAL